jgi:hypothetical protein
MKMSMFFENDFAFKARRNRFEENETELTFSTERGFLE